MAAIFFCSCVRTNARASWCISSSRFSNSCKIDLACAATVSVFFEFIFFILLMTVAGCAKTTSIFLGHLVNLFPFSALDFYKRPLSEPFAAFYRHRFLTEIIHLKENFVALAAIILVNEPGGGQKFFTHSRAGAVFNVEHIVRRHFDNDVRRDARHTLRKDSNSDARVQIKRHRARCLVKREREGGIQAFNFYSHIY